MERLSEPSFLAARYPVEPLALRLREAKLAPSAAALFPVGVLCAFLLGLELASGALLALYYQPDREAARASVQHVVTWVEYGELVRSLHGYGAHALVVALLALLGGSLATARHRRPHEVAWCALVAAWFTALAQAFTGAVLPWTGRSVINAQVASGAVAKVPLVGPWLRGLLFGSEGPPTLVRVYGLHVGALPALGLLLALVLTLHGIGRLVRPPEVQDTSPLQVLPWRGAALASAVFAALLAAAVWWPLPLEAPPSVAVGAGPPAPVWFLAPLDAALRWAPARIPGLDGATVVVTLALLGALGALALPAVDHRGGRLGQGIGLAVYSLLLGVMGLAILR